MKAVNWLKASFLAGAVADGIFGVLLLIPSRMGETESTYAMGVAASLMFGWTVLLLWGFQRPVERKGLLLITVFPVLVGVLGTAGYHLTRGTLPAERLAVALVIELALIGLLSFSLWNARGLGPCEADT